MIPNNHFCTGCHLCNPLACKLRDEIQTVGNTNKIKFPEQKTLRDEFAMAALSIFATTSLYSLGLEDEAAVARKAYAIADALLNERNKGV